MVKGFLCLASAALLLFKNVNQEKPIQLVAKYFPPD
jgi:hypothetical protein